MGCRRSLVYHVVSCKDDHDDDDVSACAKGTHYVLFRLIAGHDGRQERQGDGATKVNTSSRESMTRVTFLGLVFTAFFLVLRLTAF